MEKKFWKSGKAAKFLEISQDTLDRLEKSGKLMPHHKSLSGYKYYTREQLVEFLEARDQNIATEEKEAEELTTSVSEEDLEEIKREEEEKHRIERLKKEGITILRKNVVPVFPEDTSEETKASDIDKEEKTRERQTKPIPAEYHFFSTSKLVRNLKNIYLNEWARIELGRTGNVELIMWLDKEMQMKIMPTAFNTPKHELHPTDYDLFIIESVKSLKNAGNKEFTAAQLVKHMHGNSEGGISDDEIKFVEDRIKTMMTWFIRIEFSEQLKHYPNLPEELKDFKAIQGHLLDTVLLERWGENGTTRISFGFPINGCFGIPDDKDVAVILEKYSESTKQLTCFPAWLLNMNQMRMSRQVRILTNCLVKKIQGLKGNKKGINTIVLSTFEAEFGMTRYSPKQQSNMRKYMVTIVQNCKEKGLIKDYELITEGAKVKSIKISWEGESKKKNVRNGTRRGNKVRS